MNLTRVYTPGGRVAHLLTPSESPNNGGVALCSRSPWPGLWHGTGTQREHERAARLPVCIPCHHRAKERGWTKGWALT